MQETFVDDAEIAKRSDPTTKDERTTHVIVGEYGKRNKATGLVRPTTKINQARKHHLPLIAPSWIAESAYLWKPADVKSHQVTTVELAVKVKEKKSSKKKNVRA